MFEHLKGCAVLAVVLAVGAGCKGDKGDPGPQGEQGVQGAPGATGAVGPAGPQGPAAPGGNNLMLWGSAPSAWTQIAGVTSTVTRNTTDVREGESSFEFTVPSGTTGGTFTYGDFIAIDPTQVYRGQLSVKLVNGAGDFSAGYQAFGSDQMPIPANGGAPAHYFIASNLVLTTGAWTDLTGLVVGEGAGLDQFPVGTRFIKPIVLVNRNNIGTTLVDAFKIVPDETLRSIARWQGYAEAATDNGALPGRSVSLRKIARSTGLRVSWTDSFRVYRTSQGSNACRWEILFNSAPCTNPGGLVFNKHEGLASVDDHNPGTVSGTCLGLPPGTYTVSTRVGPAPQSASYVGSDCHTGWGTLGSLEVEEVR